MWDPPGPGGELVSLALQDGFLTTERPGKPSISVLTVPGMGQTPSRSQINEWMIDSGDEPTAQGLLQ